MTRGLAWEVDCKPVDVGGPEVVNALGQPSGSKPKLLISVTWSTLITLSLQVALGGSRVEHSLVLVNGPSPALRAWSFLSSHYQLW